MNEIVQIILAAVVSAIVGSFVGALITIAVFRSKLDSNTQAFEQFVEQRREDRDRDERESERMRQEFHNLCTGQVAARERDLEFIRRQVAALDRRSLYVLDLVTAIAGKQGIHHRITDALAHGEE